MRITNTAGLRIFSERRPPENIVQVTEIALFDGSYTFNGDILYGDGYEAILDFGGRVLNWGELRNTLLPGGNDLFSSLQSQEISTISISMDNTDKYFSKILGTENLLSAGVEVLVGFDGIARDEFIKQFTGIVQKVSLGDGKTTLNLRAV
ncbi:MAG: hypothetical protein AB1401_00535 [Thermodesulfobacteriota bacterium]